ncbi:MAG TPA: DUF4382 domain-containing protein, partial [Chitinophagaceae bacterium]|nr:DUF4382 domain-containing protein [Chitinophagaceae bacterium]
MKKKQVNILIALFMIISAVVAISACQKSVSQQSNAAVTQAAEIYLTDAPAFFDNVFIDIQAVRVKIDTCGNDHHSGDDGNGNDDGEHHNGGDDGDHHDGGDNEDHHDSPDDSCHEWITLNISAGVYDLLTLRNGAETLLAQSSNLPAGAIDKIEITLGNNNSVIVNGVTFPLQLSSNIVEIEMNGDDWEEFMPGHSRLWLDFDVAASVIEINGSFELHPVLRFFNEKETGEIEGKVTPAEAAAIIKIYNSTDTATALPDKEGEFKIRGLKPGTYTLFADASNGYADKTFTNVIIT